MIINYNIYCYLAVDDNAYYSGHYRNLHVQWHSLLEM